MEKDTIQLEVEKDFPVSVKDLANAWVDPEKLKQWWKPSGQQLTEADIDLSKGGKFKYVFQAENKEAVLEITGEYQEVVENRKLVYTWEWKIPHADAVSDHTFLLTVEFMPADNGSRLRVVQENFQDDESIHPHKKGWEDALDHLHRFLS